MRITVIMTNAIKLNNESLPTKVDDGNSSETRPNREHFNDGLDEVNNELPVVASDWVIVTYTSRVVNHKRDVSNTLCNDSSSSSSKNDYLRNLSLESIVERNQIYLFHHIEI